jgi:hypothetical protein
MIMRKFTKLFLTLTVLMVTTISVLAITAPVIVNTYDSQGNVLVAKFKVWKGPNYVGEFNTGSAADLEVGGTYMLFAHYAGTSTARQTFVVDASGNTFNYSTTKITFHWSGGYLNFRTSGSWSGFGKTDGVWNSRELFPKDANGNTMQFQIGYLWNDVRNMIFEMDYQGQTSVEKVLSQLRLRDHLGNPIEGGKARGGFATPTTYHVSGLTNAQGLLLDMQNGSNENRSFEMGINGTTKWSAQQLSSIYDFQTNLLTLRLETCAGAPLEGGHVRWGHGTNYGSYHFIGGNTSAAGETSAEMFPGTYSFEMGYKATVDFKISHNFPADGATIVFKTTKVTLAYNGSIRYGGAAGQSNHFVKPSMELMPGATVKFEFSVGGTVVDIPITGCEISKVMLQVKNELGGGVPGATFKPAIGGSWQPILSSTDQNGCLFVDLNPAWTKIVASVSNSSEEQLKAALEANGYKWTTQVLRINFKDHEGDFITDGAGYLQRGGGWPTIGTFNTSGYFDVNSFPVTTNYRGNYNNTMEQKSFTIVAGAGVQQVEFKTGQVFGCGQTQVNGSPFTDGSELMPGTYGFRWPQVTGTVTAGAITNLPGCPEPEKSAIIGDGVTPEFSFKLYPIPANSRLNVNITLVANEQVEFQVFDLTGRTVKNGTWKLNRGFNTNEIAVDDLVDGQYIFKLKSTEKVITEKFSVFK